MLPDAHRRRDLQTVLCREVSPDVGLQKVSCLEWNTGLLRVRVTDYFSGGSSALSCAAGPPNNFTTYNNIQLYLSASRWVAEEKYRTRSTYGVRREDGTHNLPTGRPIPRCHFSLSSELQHSLGRSARKEKSDTRCLKKAGSTPADSALHFPMLIPYVSLTNPAAGADK